MSSNVLKKLNKIPVRTWSWLGVNDASIELIFPEVRPYNKKFVEYKEGDGINLIALDNSIKLLPVLDDSGNHEGVAAELTEIVKRQYNTGILLNVSQGVKVLEPVHVLYEGDPENSVIVDNNVIIAEEDSLVTVIIQYKSDNESRIFHNGFTRIYGKAGSTINLIKIQTLNDKSNSFDANFTRLEQGAKVNYINVELGSHNALVNYRTELEGDNSEGSLKTLYLGDKDRSIDINHVMTHIGRRTLSNIEVRGALLDESRKIFKGTLDFKKGSARSKGREEEYAMLLSPKVVNKAVPLLLCTEDDVEGEHAASAGKIDENKLFYLMSRGFSEKEARRLIVEAAFNPVIDLIPVESIRNDILDSVKRRLSYE